jgi:hypothetical protein
VAGELERFRAELQRLQQHTGQGDLTGQNGHNPRVRVVQSEAETRAAIIASVAKLAWVADQVDRQLAESLNESVLETTVRIEARMLAAQGQVSTPVAHAIVQEASETFAQHHLAHGILYHQAYGEQAAAQLDQEIDVPPLAPRRRGFLGLFGDQS